jgi:hypothetical protein
MWGISSCRLQNIASIEELAHILTDILVDNEFTTWMVLHKSGNIKDKII